MSKVINIPAEIKASSIVEEINNWFKKPKTKNIKEGAEKIKDYFENQEIALDEKIQTFKDTLGGFGSEKLADFPRAAYSEVVQSYFKFMLINLDKVGPIFVIDPGVWDAPDYSYFLNNITKLISSTSASAFINEDIKILLNNDEKITQIKEHFPRKDFYNSLATAIFQADRIDIPTLCKEGAIFTIADQSVKAISEMVFSDLPHINPYTPLTKPPINLEKVIYNIGNFGRGITIPQQDNFKVGNPVNSGNVGYNIHIPKGEINAVAVHVYGGHQAKEREKHILLPGNLNYGFDSLLENEHIVVITLNLVDLLKLNTIQQHMPLRLHAELHRDINNFFQIIKNNPESLHMDLHILKNLPIYLYGASFGGRTAVRHAEFFPDTFDGYISLEGALDSPSVAKYAARISFKSSDRKEWLDPAKDVRKLLDPILAIQNYDDNNVPLKTAVTFYQQVKEAGKEDLVKVKFYSKGSPILGDLCNKGHGVPKDTGLLNNLVKTIVNFMKEPISKVKEMSAWTVYKYDLYSDKNSELSSLEQKFISEAFTLYKHAKHNNNTNKISYDSLMSPSAELQQQAWEEFYVPLYQVCAQIEKLNQLVKEGAHNIDFTKGEKELVKPLLAKLTPETLQAGLRQYLIEVIEFIEERYQVKISNTWSHEELSTNSILLEHYQHMFESWKDDFGGEILSEWIYIYKIFYIANPQAIDSALCQTEEDKASLNKARVALEQAINKEKDLIKSVWQKAIQLIIESNKEEKIKLASSPEKNNEEESNKNVYISSNDELTVSGQDSSVVNDGWEGD